LLLFSFNDTSHTDIYTLSLHDALPISSQLLPDTERHPRPGLQQAHRRSSQRRHDAKRDKRTHPGDGAEGYPQLGAAGAPALGARSEEHTSELQSRFDLVCRLLLEKKKI